jgi:hypothetical protein
MRRRDFISLVGAMTASWPLVTRAHQTGMKRSGLLMSTRWLPKKYYHKSQNNWDVSVDPRGILYRLPKAAGLDSEDIGIL